MTDIQEYDVALSFAGEDREYVRAVASALHQRDVRVFFDEYEQVDMWGKDLYEHLHTVYRSKARYCVIFVSEAYARKMWPTHERRSAQERALSESREYILPARFDSTELPGLHSTVGYLDLRDLSPAQLADLVLRKLGSPGAANTAKEDHPYRIPRATSPSFDPYEAAEDFLQHLTEELKNRAHTLRGASAYLSVHNRGERTCIRVVRDEKVIFSMDVWMGGLAGDKGLSFYAVDGEIRVSSSSLNAWAEIVWHNQTRRPILKLHDMSLFGSVPSSEKELAFDEFVDLTWDRIIDTVDRLR